MVNLLRGFVDIEKSLEFGTRQKSEKNSVKKNALKEGTFVQ